MGESGRTQYTVFDSG